MDDQVLQLLMNRFDRVDAELAKFNEAFTDHTVKDMSYWQKLDQQDGALGVWKWIAGLGGGSGLLAALSQWFSKH